MRSGSRSKMCFHCGWGSPATPGVKGQAADVCVAVILVCARFPSGAPAPPPPPHFLLRRLKWWRELKPQVGRADNLPEPPRTKADSCSRFYKCGMCDLSFLTSPLVLSSCNAPTLAWINNQGPNWSDPPPLQRGRSSRGPPTSLRSP